jgi:hypothetical protein
MSDMVRGIAVRRAWAEGVLVGCLFGVAMPLAGAPELTCREPTFRFGRRDESESVRHTFAIGNAGDSPLEIRSVRTSCGCTIAEMKQKSIKPGETGLIDTVFELRGRRGAQKKSVRVESNDPKQPVFLLWIEGEITSDLLLSPEYINMGTVPVADSVERIVRLESRSGDVEITEVTSGSEEFSATVGDDANGRKTLVTVATVPPLPIGTRVARFLVRTSSGKELSFAVAAIVEGEVRILPAEVRINSREAGPVRRSILIRPARVKQFEVTGVSAPRADWEVSWSRLPAGMVRIDLGGIIPSVAGEGGEIVISTDLEQMSSIRVPVRVIK